MTCRERPGRGLAHAASRRGHDACCCSCRHAAGLVARAHTLPPERAGRCDCRPAARAAADGARLLSAGRHGPTGRSAPPRRRSGSALLPFTFAGLVVGSVFYSLPFVVQPLQTAFEAMGERPMEAAATLRAGPLGPVFHCGRAARAQGFLSAAVLGFAHTVGEFGVVLMIGGNIPGETKVLSVAIYDHVEALDYGKAHCARRRHAGFLLPGAARGLRAVTPAGRRSMSGLQARFRLRRAAASPSTSNSRRRRAASPRCSAPPARARPPAALHRRPGARPRRVLSRSTAKPGRTTRTAISSQRTSAPAATCSRKRACSLTSRCGATSSTATSGSPRLRAASPSMTPWRFSAWRPSSNAGRTDFPAASASASPSGARCSRARACC